MSLEIQNSSDSLDVSSNKEINLRFNEVMKELRKGNLDNVPGVTKMIKFQETEMLIASPDSPKIRHRPGGVLNTYIIDQETGLPKKENRGYATDEQPIVGKYAEGVPRTVIMRNLGILKYGNNAPEEVRGKDIYVIYDLEGNAHYQNPDGSYVTQETPNAEALYNEYFSRIDSGIGAKYDLVDKSTGAYAIPETAFVARKAVLPTYVIDLSHIEGPYPIDFITSSGRPLGIEINESKIAINMVPDERGVLRPKTWQPLNGDEGIKPYRPYSEVFPE